MKTIPRTATCKQSRAGPTKKIGHPLLRKRGILLLVLGLWLVAGGMAVSALDAATAISLHTSVTLPIDI